MKALFLPVLIFFSAALSAQDSFEAKILNILGVVEYNGEVLSKGDIISIREDESSLDFKSKGSALKVCYNNCSETMILFEELITKDYKVPKLTLYEALITKNKLYTREFDASTSFFDYLEKCERLWIVNSLRIDTEGSDYNFDDAHFLFVRFWVENIEINKPIPLDKTDLVFDSTMFIIDGVFKLPESLPVSLYYYDSEKETSELITKNFWPVFLKDNAYATVENIMDNPSLDPETQQRLINEFMQQQNQQ